MAKRGRPKQSEARKALVDNINKVFDKLKDRIPRVEARFGKTFGVEEFYNRGLDTRSVKGLSMEELSKLYRDVSYVEGLGTTRVSGVEHLMNVIQPILDLKDVSESLPRDIFEIYGRLVEEKRILENFKYQVLETIADLVIGGFSKKEIAENIRSLYETIVGGKGVDVSSGFQYSGKVRGN